MQLHIRQHLHIMSDYFSNIIKKSTIRTKIQLLIKNIQWEWVNVGVERKACSTRGQSINPFYAALLKCVCVRCACCSATLLAFLVELLKSSVAMQEQMLGGKGFLVIGYLLEKVSKRPPRWDVCVTCRVYLSLAEAALVFTMTSKFFKAYKSLRFIMLT